MKFSVITPVNLWTDERIQKFLQCIESIKNQTFKDFEWIIIDDGSPKEFLWSLAEVAPQTRIIHKEHGERVIAYNKAFQEAEGEWFTFLDSDDEYKPEYLERVSQMIQENPDYKMFNFGCEYHHKDGKITTRDAFKPAMLEVGHEKFGGGKIVNGTFVFHRSVYEDLGGFMPDVVENIDCSEINYGEVRNLYANTPYDFAAYYQIKYPELREYFMVNHKDEPNKIIKELGNPWGQDFALFYQYTRKYHSKPFDEYLYVVNPK